MSDAVPQSRATHEEATERPGRPRPAARLGMLALYVGPVLFVVISTFQLIGGTRDWEIVLLKNALMYLVGVFAIMAGFGHIFFADPIAESIGWQKGSPFQYEVGVANVGIGVLGVMGTSFGRGFWLAAILMFSVFYWGAAIGHIGDMIRNKNRSPGNAGFIFYYDLIVPALLWILYAATR